MLRQTLCRLAPPCPFHLPFTSYCDVAQARSYFASTVLPAGWKQCAPSLTSGRRWTSTLEVTAYRSSRFTVHSGMRPGRVTEWGVREQIGRDNVRTQERIRNRMIQWGAVLFTKCHTSDEIKVDMTGRACSTNGRDYKCINNFNRIWNEIPFGKSRHEWDDNIKIDLKEILCEDVDWVKLTQDRVEWNLGFCEQRGVPWPAVGLLPAWDNVRDAQVCLDEKNKCHNTKEQQHLTSEYRHVLDNLVFAHCKGLNADDPRPPYCLEIRS
jgi:hypothetical protein